MTLIDGDRIVTAQLYDDEHEEFIEKRMSINEYINAYTDEGVIRADDILSKIRAEIEEEIVWEYIPYTGGYMRSTLDADKVLEILDKYKAESEVTE